MEPVGSFFDEEWESMNRMFSTERADFMLQLHGDDHGLFSTNDDGSALISSALWEADLKNVTISGIDENIFSYNNTNLEYLSQECSINSTSGSDLNIFFPNNGSLQPNNDYVNNLLEVANNNIDESIDINVTGHDNPKNNVMEDMPCFKEEMGSPPTRVPVVSTKEMQLKRKIDKLENQQGAEDQKFKDSPENQKKRSRVSRNGPRNKKNAQSKAKKNKKSITPIENEGEGEGEEEITNPAGQSIERSSCSASSENDSNASQELNGDSKESVKGKTRASRGAATDPQSLYARKRRERINERLKMLQNLVPNGTKVDISTMLEEAVHYVKFLQLQIKLLSSEELWMYAPIAYNGMDIGFYQKILPSF